MPDGTPLFRRSACEVVGLLEQGSITPLDALDAMEARVREVDGVVNALPTTAFDRARESAGALMRKPAGERGVLAGLPVVIKDLADVAGVRSTQGSTVFENHVPERSSHVVTTIEDAGGVVAAMSNTPEFGAGGNTFNDVFGATLNPWDTALSAAGSSGGSAVALATGTAWLAHGSDLGGSLRNPASFNSVVGLRPSPGRVASGPCANPFDTLAVEGPMARSVEDAALFLDAMAVTDPRSPVTLETPGRRFLDHARERRLPGRAAFSMDLGITPVDPKVRAAVTRAVESLAAAGIEVVEAHPDMTGAHEAFQVLRAHGFASSLDELHAKHRDRLKPEVVWNIEKGLGLSGADIARAERLRGALFARAEEFMRDFDLLLTPATITGPYPVEQRYVEACDGVGFETYVDWLAIAYAITLTGLPALSLPAGLMEDGLPVGLQCVGRPRGEAALLAHAAALEPILGAPALPIEPRTA